MKLNRQGWAINLVLAAGLGVARPGSFAQAPVAATAKPASQSQRGTVKAVSGNSLTVTTDAGPTTTITVGEGARIVQVAPGSTDLKAAATITLSDIVAGDKVLVTGKAGETANAFTATRVILMKSGDIAQKHVAEQADWQKRGVGGIVTASDGSGTLTISAGAKKIQVHTTSSTIFRRYAGDSVKFEDAKSGTFAQIQAADQLEVRGAKTDDGLSIQADEVVSGAFRNLSGTLAAVNATTGTITLKDLTTKKTVTVTVTANSDMRKLPPEVAARFAARQRGGVAAGATAAAIAERPTETGTPVSGSRGVPSVRVPGQQGAPSASGNASGAGMSAPSGGNGRSAGMDLSKMLSRLPTATLGDLHTGDAVMIVASQPQPGSDAVTAVTLLAGVESILAATPSGSQGMTLSPWSVGNGAPEGGGGTP